MQNKNLNSTIFIIQNKNLKRKKTNDDLINYYNMFFKSHTRNYKKLMQFALQKGKKNKIENIFRKSLFHLVQNKKYKNQSAKIINKAVNLTTPYINVKTKRLGSRNVYIPKRMKKNFSEFLSSKWILESAKNRSENEFYKKLVNELVDIVTNKSNAAKKKTELHKLAADNLKNK